jgi:hypothetical protein
VGGGDGGEGGDGVGGGGGDATAAATDVRTVARLAGRSAVPSAVVGRRGGWRRGGWRLVVWSTAGG